MSDKYDVGYGKPPKQHRFKPGNQAARKRKGRRKKKSPSIEESFIAGWQAKKTFKIGDEMVDLSSPQILERRMPELMATGSPRDIAIILQMVDRYLPKPRQSRDDELTITHHRAEGSNVPLPDPALFGPDGA